MSDRPIADYALLSDCDGSALISNDGSLDWPCLPRFDSRSVFAKLLDDDAGHRSIRPVEPFTVECDYVDETMVVRTVFSTSSGAIAMTDVMALGPNYGGHDLGKDPLYAIALSSTVPLTIARGTAPAWFPLRSGQEAAFALQFAPAGERPRWWTQRDVVHGITDTIKGWRSWSVMHQSYERPWRDLVHHSGRVLQALTYAPTGVSHIGLVNAAWTIAQAEASAG